MKLWRKGSELVRKKQEWLGGKCMRSNDLHLCKKFTSECFLNPRIPKFSLIVVSGLLSWAQFGIPDRFGEFLESIFHRGYAVVSVFILWNPLGTVLRLSGTVGRILPIQFPACWFPIQLKSAGDSSPVSGSSGLCYYGVVGLALTLPALSLLSCNLIYFA